MRPPLPFRPAIWRSPLRGPWLTSIFGVVLLAALPIVIVTGLLSYIAYGPQFGQAIPADVGWLKLPTFLWPTRPSWLYRLAQGVHVVLGLVLVPVVLAKLWSVIPRLFAWPPVRSPAHLLERASVGMVIHIVLSILLGVVFAVLTTSVRANNAVLAVAGIVYGGVVYFVSSAGSYRTSPPCWMRRTSPSN